MCVRAVAWWCSNSAVAGSEGITLSGGGAQLFGLDGGISDQLKIRTTLADEPDLCVAHGLSELIDDEERYENIDLVSGSRSDLLGDD